MRRDADDLPTLLARMYADGPRYDVSGHEIVVATFVPHDPVNPDAPHDQQTCNLCAGEPFGRCAQRLAQRRVIQREALPFLRSALYARDESHSDTDPECGMRWTSPLEWSAFLGYGVHDAFMVTASLHDGRVWDSTLHLSTWSLDELVA